jgi:hypothetical protein
VDPFKEKPKPVEGAEVAQEEEKEEPGFKFQIGHQNQDALGGDLSIAPKNAHIFPSVYFIRSQYCAKDHTQQGNSKSVKKFYVTTSLLVVYKHDFQAHVYSIQKPTKESIPLDYSYDFHLKKLVAKKN